MSNVTSTKRDFTLNNGEVVKLTLNFGALYKLRAKNKKLYDEYNASERKTADKFEELDMALIIFTAYTCANIDNDSRYDMETFYGMLPDDREVLADMMQLLLNPQKKRADSQKHFPNKQN